MNSLINSTFGVITCCAASFFIAIFIESIMLPRILLISRRKRLYDMPDKRKSHKNPIPRLAGITFFPVIMLSFLSVSGLQAIYTTELFSTIHYPPFFHDMWSTSFSIVRY